MGTSSSYNGISGKTNLLPSGWLDDKIIADLIGPKKNKEVYTEEEKNKALANWKTNIANAKTLFTHSFSTRSSSSIKRALSSYKNIYGGHSGYVKHLSSYSGSIYDIGIALSKLSNEGSSGVRYLNIDTQGKSASEILLLISKVLSPSGDTKENTVIREAIIQTLNEMDNVEILNDSSSITQNQLNDIMKQYLGNLLLSDLLTFMGTNLDKLLPSQRKEYEEELKRCIEVQVYNQFRDYDFNMDKSVKEVQNSLDSIIKQISEVFDKGDSND
jgi:predicted Zn-dependent peptidase